MISNYANGEKPSSKKVVATFFLFSQLFSASEKGKVGSLAKLK